MILQSVNLLECIFEFWRAKSGVSGRIMRSDQNSCLILILNRLLYAIGEAVRVENVILISDSDVCSRRCKGCLYSSTDIPEYCNIATVVSVSNAQKVASC